MEFFDFEMPEERREEFLRYLRRTGVLDVLTNLLRDLHEQPRDPLNHMCNTLNNQLYGETVHSLIIQHAETLIKILKVTKENAVLRRAKQQSSDFDKSSAKSDMQVSKGEALAESDKHASSSGRRTDSEEQAVQRLTHAQWGKQLAHDRAIVELKSETSIESGKQLVASGDPTFEAKT